MNPVDLTRVLNPNQYLTASLLRVIRVIKKGEQSSMGEHLGRT